MSQAFEKILVFLHQTQRRCASTKKAAATDCLAAAIKLKYVFSALNFFNGS